MKSVEKFRTSIQSNKACMGVSVSFTDPLVSLALAQYFDFIWLELEHCIMNPEAVMGHIVAGFSKDIPTFIRVPGSSTHIIKPYLDSGACGIIVPQVKTAEEVKKIVMDCRYPPMGERGFGPRIPSNFDRNNGKDFVKWTNNNIFVAVMIENCHALDSLDEILEIQGLDSVVIGPADLSGSFGLLGDIDHPRVQSAIDMIIEKARKAGKYVGAGIAPETDAAMSMIKRGVQWLQLGNDFHYLSRFAEKLTSEIRTAHENRQ